MNCEGVDLIHRLSNLPICYLERIVSEEEVEWSGIAEKGETITASMLCPCQTKKIVSFTEHFYSLTAPPKIVILEGVSKVHKHGTYIENTIPAWKPLKEGCASSTV
jgi:hypothetical protein